MMTKRCLLLLLLLAGVLAQVQPARCASIKTWMCAYGPEIGQAELGHFDLVVLDGFRHPPLEPRKPGGPLLLGSVFAGESEVPAPSWEQAHDQAYSSGANAKAMRPVQDIRSPQWQARLLEEVIPQVLAQGFDGVLLDSIDVALAKVHGGGAAQQAELRAGVLAFLKRLREKHPALPIAMNRGLELMPEAAPFLNFLLVEELSLEYDFGTKEYRQAPPQVRQVVVSAVRRAQAANPGLTVLTLDYAAPDQGARITEAIRYARGKGFVPYVSTPALDQVFRHTLPR